MSYADSTDYGMRVGIQRSAKEKKNWREIEWIVAIFDYLIVDIT